MKSGKKSERLILYFGHEAKTEKAIDILDTTSNEGKNHLIVEFLIKLSDEFIKYNKNVKSGDLSQSKARLDYVYDEIKFYDSFAKHHLDRLYLLRCKFTATYQNQNGGIFMKYTKMR